MYGLIGSATSLAPLEKKYMQNLFHQGPKKY